MALNVLVFLATLIGMEGFALVAHKYVMHGWGWGWHRSHHEPRSGWFEKMICMPWCLPAWPLC